jgi:hypothetical protein
MLDELTPQVRSLLVDCRTESPRVEVVDEDLDGRQAMSYDDRIVLGTGARGKERSSLAHELVHWYAAGYWDALPHAIEEGLADLIAIRLVPTRAAEKRMQAHWMVRGGIEGLWPILEPQELLDLSCSDIGNLAYGPELSSVYALGFVVAEAIGIDGLRDLCLAARRNGLERLPAEELLRAASIDPGHMEMLADRLTPWPVVPGHKGTLRLLPNWER